jgi:hypothetical protein
MENNIMMSEVPTNPAPAQAPMQDVPIEIQLVNTPVTDETSALNVLVGFIALAQKRGTFNIQESAKLWDCIQRFSQPPK